MKTCIDCKEQKPFEAFSKRAEAADGLKPQCKACAKIAYATWYASHQEVRQASKAKWQRENAELAREHRRKWNRAHAAERAQAFAAYRLANLETIRKRLSVWQKGNLGKVAAARARRRASILRATPTWINAFVVEEIYLLAQLRTTLTGVPHHVDHFIPLTNSEACGLHVEGNLRVIEWVENLRKGNKLEAAQRQP